MSVARTRVMALVTSTACLVLTAGVNAEPSSTRAQPSAGVNATPVDVVLVGRAGTEGSLAERIRSWFGVGAVLSIKNEQKLVAERVLGPLPTRRVAVWVTERTPGEARLYFAVTGEAQGATRYLIRDVPLNQGFDEIGSERVAQVVHSSVTALIDSSIEVAGRPEIERLLATPVEPYKPSLARPRKPVYVPVQKSRRKPPHAEPESPGPSFAPLAGLFYRGALSGDEGFAHGPGLALGATLRFGDFGIGAVTRGEYVLPHSERFEVLDMTLWGVMGRLGLRGEWIASEVLHHDVELGAGLVWMRYDPEAPITPSGPLPFARDIDPRFFGFASFGLSRRAGPIRIGGRLELELYPVRSHYDLDSGREIGSAAQFQPGLALEIVFD
jgi:hypothetical protein